jgi:HK97 family phage major capsid protein
MSTKPADRFVKGHRFRDPALARMAAAAAGTEATMLDPSDVEADVTKLRALIDTKQKEQITARTAADELRDKMQEGGFDVTKLATGDADTRAAFDKIDEAYKVADGLADELVNLRQGLEKMYGWTGRTGSGADTPPGGPGADGNRQRESFGRRFVRSEAFQAAKRSGALAVPEGARLNVNLGPVMTREEFMAGLRQRAGLDLASGQAMVTPEFQLIPPVELPVRPVKLLDLINMETTDTDAVVWGQQTARILAAQPTASGTNAPQATMAFQRQTSIVRRIPVLLTVPKEVLADEGRLQGILDRQLLADARLTVEFQALDGDGTGENFDGILQTTGIGNVAKLHGDYDLDPIHRGITYVRLHLFDDPDAIGVHPTDLEHIMLQKDNYGRYIFEPSAEQTSIWGFKAVSTPVFSAGTGLVGSYRMGSTMWLREDVVITATDGYTDVASGTNYFSAGLVAILAQVRAAYAVERPFAYCEVTGLGTTP